MKRGLVVLLAGALCASPIIVFAQQAAKPAAYKAPRNNSGQPDFSGFWTNATITPQTRPAQYGTRLNHTPAEVKQLENASQAGIERGNQSTDPNAAAPTAGADVGGYNRGWLDPGVQVMRVDGQPRTSLITTADGQVPARKGAAAGGRGGAIAALAAGRGGGRGGGAAPAAAALAARGGQFDNPEQRPLGERCIISFGRNAGPPMMPNGFYNNNYQFVQTKNTIAINVEMVHDTRIIHLDTKTHQPPNVRPWMGDSIGWFEGDTLVVETTNMPQRQAYQGSWENLKVTERFTRVGPGRIDYKFTIDDPTMWDKPWGGEYEFVTLNGDIREYACHEGNYALEGILAGARNDERIAAEKAAAPRPSAAR